MADKTVTPGVPKGRLRCRPGDLAIVVRSPDTEKVGRIVLVLRPVKRGECWELRDTWLCKSLSGPFMNRHCWADGSELEYRMAMECGIADRHLVPLRPGADDEATLLERSTHATEGGAASARSPAPRAPGRAQSGL